MTDESGCQHRGEFRTLASVHMSVVDSNVVHRFVNVELRCEGCGNLMEFDQNHLPVMTEDRTKCGLAVLPPGTQRPVKYVSITPEGNSCGGVQ